MVITMFRKFIDEYLLLNEDNEKKRNYNKAALISLLMSSIPTVLWIILIVLLYTLPMNFFYSILIILTVLFSYVINSTMFVISMVFLVLQIKVSINKYTIFSIITSSLLLLTIILSIYLI